MEGKYVRGMLQLSLFMICLGIPLYILFRILFHMVMDRFGGIALATIDDSISLMIPWKLLVGCMLMAFAIFAWSLWDAGRSESDHQ
jgi:hypothetical protein